MTAAEAVVRAIYGRCLTAAGPVPFSRMVDDERAAVLAPFEAALEADAKAIAELIEAARREGAAKVYTHIRKADAFDPEMVDQVMEALASAEEER
jgi:hypothetical protein